MKYETRQELNALSKEVFGSSSRWQKLITKGFVYPHVEVQKKIIPNELGKLENKEFKVSKPILIHHNEETVLQLMKNLKAERDAKKPAGWDSPTITQPPSAESTPSVEGMTSFSCSRRFGAAGGTLTQEMLQNVMDLAVKG